MSPRAAVVREFGAPDGISVETVHVPEPGPGEVLIEVRAAGVNFPDLMVVDGTYQNLPDLPFSPGKEVAGGVAAVGVGVTGFEGGERVMAQMEYGGYGERVVAGAANTVPIPPEMGFEEAAAFGLTHLTAHFALVRRAGLLPGETVLVTGAAGGVGSAGVQVARALGATVIATASTGEKRAFALELGAEHAIAPEPEGFKERVMELTGGNGADVILETVGGDVFDACMRAIAWEGRLVVVGFAGGRVPTVKAGLVLVKNMSVVGLQVSDYRDREPESVRGALKEMLGLYADRRLKVPIAASYPLEAVARALEEVRRGEVRGKVVLTMGEG